MKIFTVELWRVWGGFKNWACEKCDGNPGVGRTMERSIEIAFAFAIIGACRWAWDQGFVETWRKVRRNWNELIGVRRAEARERLVAMYG
jgi:hypothetical protein